MLTPPKRERIPAAPFAAWLNSRVDHWERKLRFQGQVMGGCGLPTGENGPLTRVCQEVGWSVNEAGVRRLYRMRRQLSESSKGKRLRAGNPGVRVVTHIDLYLRDVVEEALFHAGVPFADLYPDIAAREEVDLEPEAWCPGCREERLPINGQCPFCEWRIGPETGQTLMGRLLVRVAA